MPQALNNAIEIQGIVCFRNLPQRYANTQDVLATVGSYGGGGRFNLPKNFGVLYLSCDFHTCVEELQHSALKEGLPVESKLPRAVIGVELKLSKVLDLTDASVCRGLGINRKELVETDWAKENAEFREARTQVIGRIAREIGFEAILAPSARWSGRNLNLLDDGNLLSKALVKNIDELCPKRHARRRPRKPSP